MKLSLKTKIERQMWAGISAVLVGLYMIVAVNEVRGTIPIVIGVSLLLWRF